MSDDNKYNTQDMVIAAIEQSPVDFENAFNDVIVGKIQAAIENQKIKIASQMYGYEDEEEAEVEPEEDLDYTEED